MKTFAVLTLGSLAMSQAFMAPSPAAFGPISRSAVRSSAGRSMRMENFNLPVGEDQAENVPTSMLGEANYRKFVASYKPDGMIVGGARYPLFRRVSELKLLSLTAETGLLTRLEELGLKLSDLEKLLPLAEELQLLQLAEKNQDLILQTLAPIAIEQAPALLPILTAVLRTPPTTFYAVAAAALAAEAGIVLVSGNPLIDVLAGIPLVGVAAVSAVAGTILSSGISVPSAGPRKIRSVSSSSSSADVTPKFKVGGGAKSGRVKAAKPINAPVVTVAPPKKASAPVVRGPLSAPARSGASTGVKAPAPKAAPAVKKAAAAPKAAPAAKKATPAAKAAPAVKKAAPAAKKAAPAAKKAAPAAKKAAPAAKKVAPAATVAVKKAAPAPKKASPLLAVKRVPVAAGKGSLGNIPKAKK